MCSCGQINTWVIKHFLSLTNFKSDRYLNNFEEHLFGLLRLRKYQTSQQNYVSHT